MKVDNLSIILSNIVKDNFPNCSLISAMKYIYIKTTNKTIACSIIYIKTYSITQGD
jgi:hypothetical protein